MKEYASEDIRNVALTGHQGAGKTSLVEALLFNTDAINRLGTVEEGNTVSDWDDDEKERGLSLTTSLVPVEFNETKINLLDTPGYTDFQGEVINAVSVADSVVVLVDAVAGVEVGTELAWEYARASHQPIMVVINKLDRDNADFEGTLDSLKTSFSGLQVHPGPCLPVGVSGRILGRDQPDHAEDLLWRGGRALGAAAGAAGRGRSGAARNWSRRPLNRTMR